MKYQELLILLPCHSLEDFPTHHEGDDAEGLLAGWSALWHPALLAAAGRAPCWYRVDDPPEELDERLIVIPAVSHSDLPTGFAQRAKAAGARLIRRQPSREQIVADALAELDGGDRNVSADLAADFLALGYCHLQVELLTRQMRYSSNLDELHFHNEALAAAAAAVEGDEARAREKLAACFDLLAEERDHYYSVDCFVVDLILVAASALGVSLRQELSQTTPFNVLLSGKLLERMAVEEPRTLELLREVLASGRASLVGGEAEELRLPLLAAETVLANLREGLETCERLLGHRPHTFGRRRFGLTPLLPQVLTKLGFRGAIHATLDEGRFPEGGQIKTRWEGSGGAAIDALARAPLNAAEPATFLSYAGKLGESMDMDHVATLFLAHWPGRSRTWLGDLHRIASYNAALGRLVTLDEYFQDTDLAGHMDRFEADQYRSPYLKQAVVRHDEDPISTSIRYWRRRATRDSLQALDTLVVLLNGAGSDQVEPLGREVDRQCEHADESPGSGHGGYGHGGHGHGGGESPDDQPGLDERLAREHEAAAAKLAERLPRGEAAAQDGYLVCNPFSFVRRVGLAAPRLAQLPQVERPVYAADAADGMPRVVVDVPAMGFVWVQPGTEPPRASRKKQLLLAEDGVLRNEFFEVLINSETGAIQSIHEYETRGNRLSQQLAFRRPSRERPRGADYTVMAADAVRVITATPIYGELESEGRLLDQSGEVVAGFRQNFQLWRGSRVLRVRISLEPHVEPKADPWNSYYACRFAWAEETAELWRTVNQTRSVVTAKRFEAPNYIEIDESRGRTAILTGGLPFHQRAGGRMLDSLLMTRGERQREFELGIGIDLPQPGQEAQAMLAPPAIIEQTAAAPRPQSSGWLFHLDSRNVLPTHWEPLREEGRVVGLRVRLLETAGRAARCRLRCLRPVGSAEQRDFRGQSLGKLRVEGDAVALDMAAQEWLEVEARWKT